MSDSLLQFLSVDSVNKLREKQTNDKVKAMTDDELLTLIGIKILNAFYKGSKKLWILVEKKSRKTLQSKMSNKDITKILAEVEPCFSISQL